MRTAATAETTYADPSALLTLYVHQPGTATPETAAMAANERERLMKALELLPVRSREVIVLRELEGCSYKEIAAIAAVPIGTVMSTLARARERLLEILRPAIAKEVRREL